MKRAILILLMVPVFAFAQKPIKPNLNKTLKLYQDNKLDEAKAMIDAAEADPKLSLDGKTYFYKGLIYAALDTTKNAAFSALATDAFPTAMKAFQKADELDVKKKGYFLTDPITQLPVPKEQLYLMLANHYLNTGAAAYQQDEFGKAYQIFKKSIAIVPTDTTSYFYAGFAAYQNEEYKAAIEEVEKYIANGGKSQDAYNLAVNAYQGGLSDKEKALEWTKKARAKFPNDKNLPKQEIGFLIELNKIDEAKTGLEAAVSKEPNNKTLLFYLGYVNSKQEKWEESQKNYESALRIDPDYFDAQYYLAQIYLIKAEKVKKQMNDLGISKEDQKKKIALDAQLVESYKIALPYWEKANSMKIEDQQTRIEVLDKLSTMYYYLGEDAKAAAVAKKLKELGVDN